MTEAMIWDLVVANLKRTCRKKGKKSTRFRYTSISSTDGMEWIKALTFHKLERGHLFLKAESNYQRDIIDLLHSKKILEAAQTILPIVRVVINA